MDKRRAQLLVAAAGLLLAGGILFTLPGNSGGRAAGAGQLTPVYAKGFAFLAGLDLQKDTMTAEELQANPPSPVYGNVSELELYRQLDFFIDVRFLEDAFARKVPAKSQAAAFRFAWAVQAWEKEGVDYRYFDPAGVKGTYAFDLYCIIALQQGSRGMEQKVLADLERQGWHTQEAEPFRVITDESWCYSLLARFRSEPQRLETAVAEKKQELEAFLARPAPQTFREDPVGQFVFRAQKAFAVTHVLMLLQEMKDDGYAVDEAYFGQLQARTAQDTLAHSDQTDYLVNGLYWLAQTDYADAPALEKMQQALLEKQGMDGGWAPAFDSAHYRGLMTSRALLALDAFERYGARKA